MARRAQRAGGEQGKGGPSQRFSFGSAAEVLDDDAGEEGDGVEVGFGFGDGYDLGSAA